jgi:hypothetical protein
MSFVPAISPDIFALRPDFTALSLYVESVRNTESDARRASLLGAACEALGAAPWAEAHLEAWRDAYRAFGAKPQRKPCSAEAPRRHALQGPQAKRRGYTLAGRFNGRHGVRFGNMPPAQAGRDVDVEVAPGAVIRSLEMDIHQRSTGVESSSGR